MLKDGPWVWELGWDSDWGWGGGKQAAIGAVGVRRGTVVGPLESFV